jgi:SWI/SNF-related matrix-associated actin-dependent regulator of chromatin subfamily D
MIINDANLQAIFGIPRMSFSSIPELLKSHLFPPDPLVINYEVRVDTPQFISPFAVDVEVEIPDPMKAMMQGVLMSTLNQKEIVLLDQRIVDLVALINKSKLKRDFLLAFSEDPVNFLNKWILSQTRDLEVQRMLRFLFRLY